MNAPLVAAPGLTCSPGQTWPFGASCMTRQGQSGVNFAVYSRHAEQLAVCLYDPTGQQETARLALPRADNGVWSGFVAGLGPGQLYGLRAHGPYQPRQGHRFNPAKLLIDPFARALLGPVAHLSLEHDYLGQPPLQATALDALPDPTDNAARIPKTQVLDLDAERRFGAGVAARPHIAPAQTVLYEAHVKGLTQLHPEVPPEWRGRFAGLVSPPLLAHYQRLGITTLCLLPVQLHLTEAHLLKKGLRNYWGYNTLGFFIPEPSYASAQFANERAEFRHMVDQLHRHGLEVVLDVVYNHSAESDTFGPTLSWRGLDNASWYALDRHAHNLNYSGCGNSLNLAQPCAVAWVMDSLRWWVQVFGVDGFRFDLAPALGRDPLHGPHFHPHAGLLSAMAQDPVLAGIKLIAEPWDLGPHGYQLGRFPAAWLEWNDHFRDTSRAFWLGFDTTRGAFARRLTGSNDFFDHGGRSPLSSVNLITAHDGMTLADLTAYRYKHNEPNGEHNHDGHYPNFSANAGVEGPTENDAVLAVRGQWRRALLATLLCAQGTPQLLAGDELGHTQHGNNNAYCQDNETTWLHWPGDQFLCDFVAALVHLRRAHAALRHARWYTGVTDLLWRQPDGRALTHADWDDPHARSLGCLIDVGEIDEAGEVASPGPVSTERWLLMCHAAGEDLAFSLPPGRWLAVLNSARALVLPQAQWAAAPVCRDTFVMPARAVVALVQTQAMP